MSFISDVLKVLGFMAMVIGILLCVGFIIAGTPFVAPYTTVAITFAWGGTAVFLLGFLFG